MTRMDAVCRILPWLGAGLCLATACASAAERPTGSAVPLAKLPTLDGEVAADPAWRGLAPFTGFTQLQPNNGEAASQRTEAFIGFTDDALYIGVICHEDDPSAVTISNLGFQSDSFTVVVDAFRTERSGVVFGTNPVGAEYDGQVMNGSVDWNWSTVWEVRATIGETGWSAEFRIPFKSLRYGADAEQTWGINMARSIQRNNEIAYWAPVPRQMSMFRLDLAGTLQGLRAPPTSPRNLKITPYALGGLERDQHGNETRGEDFGFDVKYSITPGLTLDVTYNTDFAQVESDRQQVNFGRFNLFFPETRPFFLENAGLFQAGVPGQSQLFHSRRIGIAPNGRRLPIQGGVRVSGKLGTATNVGFLHMRAESAGAAAEADDFTVLRMSRDLKDRSAVGFIATDRRGGEAEGQTYGANGSWSVGENFLLRGFVARTKTPEAVEDDHAFTLNAGYDSPTWSYYGTYHEVGAGFDPLIGFVSRRNYRAVNLFAQRTWQVQDLWGLNEWKPHVSYDSFWNFDGYHESSWLHIDNWVVWKNGADLWTAVNYGHEGVREPFFIAGHRVAAGDYDDRQIDIGASTPQTGRWSGGVYMSAGGFYGGDQRTFSPFVNYRRDETFSAFASWNHNAIDLPGDGPAFDVNLARIGVSYSFTPKIGVQTLVQYNDADDVLAGNLRFSWLRSANAGLYLVYNEVDDRSPAPRRSRQEVVIKYSHIFDVL